MNSVCVNCQYPNPENAPFCLNCGKIHRSQDTHRLTEADAETTKAHFAQHMWGNVFLERPQVLVLEIAGHQLTMPIQDEMILGRSIGIETSPIDFDLTYFRAREYGVSRRHLSIKRQALFIYATDLNARNGTWINDQRLTSGSARLLRHNDRLKLGRLSMRVLFGQAEDAPQAHSQLK